jgi:hypothetical protein
VNLKQRLRGLASFYAMMAANVDAPNERDAYEQTSGLATEAADAIERLEAELADAKAKISVVRAEDQDE